MAQSYTTKDGITVYVPNTYVSTSVKSGSTNSASAGVVTLVGEADEGPAWVDEEDLSSVVFTPDSFGEVQQKYGSGNIVDAFKAIVAAANDPAIVGGVAQVRVVKTNKSVAATSSIKRSGFGEFATLTARREGYPGNLVKYSSDVAIAEIAPSIDKVIYAPHYLMSTVAFAICMNGGVAKNISVPAKLAPTDLSTLIEDTEKGILCVGGDKLDVLSGLVGTTLTAAAPAADQLTVTLQTGFRFVGTIDEGDVLVIAEEADYGAAQDSVIGGAGGQNFGAYIVQSVSNTLTAAFLVLKRVSSGVTAAVSGNINADETDIIVYKSLDIQNMTGQDRKSLVGLSGSFTSISNNGTTVVLSLPSAFSSKPSIGDIVTIPSAFASIAAGFYMVSAVSNDQVTFWRLSNGSAGSTTSTESVALPIEEEAQPIKFLRPVIDGTGKVLEVIGDVSSIFFDSDGNASGYSNIVLRSTTEYVNAFSVKKGETIVDTFESGGDILLKVRSSKEGATLTVAEESIVGKVAGVIDFTMSFKQFKTIKDVSDFIGALDGWYAEVGSPSFNTKDPVALDDGVYGVYGVNGWTGYIKGDAYAWLDNVNGSGLAYPIVVDKSGLPEITPISFLSGGAKAGTSSAESVAAIDACEDLVTNFVVPLFSQDASLDITEGVTESSSTYAIDAINAYLKGHVIEMSKVKARSNRVACVSKWGTYDECVASAGNLSSSRVFHAFQKINNVNPLGIMVTYQPWMAAVNAAGMQAAAGYRGIVKKFANIFGVIDPVGFKSGKLGHLEKALRSGLCPLERVSTGGYRWVSDQTSYAVDSNFVYNSLQAVYISDLMALTMIDRFDRLIVGKSVADISAAAALSIVETEMYNFFRLKWIASSDDAPRGFLPPTIKIKGGVLSVELEVKLAGIIYFVPISFSISEVTQTA